MAISEMPPRSRTRSIAEFSHPDMERLFPVYRRNIANALIQLKLFQPADILPTLSLPPTVHANGAPRRAGYLVDELEITVLDGDQPSGKRQDVLYVGFMLPHSETSNHIHEEPIEEAYYIVDGEAIIQGRKLNRGAYYATYAYEDHVVHTENHPALYIIDMKNAGSIPRELRHKADYHKGELRQHGTLLVVES